MKLAEIINNIETNKGKDICMPTGFNKLDKFLDGGFFRKELIIIGGGSGSGKSYIAGTIFKAIASQAFKTGYFSLEISNSMVVSRLIAQKTNIKFSRILYGFLNLDEQRKINDAKIDLKVWEDYMDFNDEIYEYDKIEEEIKKNKYDFVVVDFIQNIVGKGKDEYSNLSDISLRLQKLAKECNCCILALSQLSNSVNRSGGEISEFKGSSSIMNVCDLGFFILRKSSGENQVTDEFILKIKKNRRGISGLEFDFRFIQEGGQIVEI